MKRKYILLTLTIVIMGIISVACGKNVDNKSTEISEVQSGKSDTTEESEENTIEIESQNELSDSQEEQSEEQNTVIELSNTYTTQFSIVKGITYPNFIFDYPNNWTVTKEEVTQTGETVILSNSTGATITFSHIGGIAEGQLGSGSSIAMKRVEISKVRDSQFIPGYVQATDYSDLGGFMVAKLKVTGQLDMQTDTDFQNVDGAVSYAIVPESWTGIRDDVHSAFTGEFAFWYSDYISFIAESPNGQFTSDEEKEIIEILSSFRTEN